MRVFYPRYDRDSLVALLKGRLPGLQGKLTVRRAALFGSYATGRQTAASDIDLLIVYAGEPRDDAFAVVKRTLDIRGLEPHVLSEAEYDAVKGVWSRMLENSIPLV